MNQVEFFNNIAEKWDSKIKVDDKKISKLLSQISIKEGSDILDIGTGTGVLIPFFKQLNFQNNPIPMHSTSKRELTPT